MNTPPFVLSPFEVKHLPLAVLRELKEHRGKQNAITGQGLSALLGHKDDRKIRVAIRLLIAEGYPIASSVGGNMMGFYICDTEQEATAYIRTLRGRAEEDLARLRDFEEAAAKQWAVPKQPSLF